MVYFMFCCLHVFYIRFLRRRPSLVAILIAMMEIIQIRLNTSSLNPEMFKINRYSRKFSEFDLKSIIVDVFFEVN